MSEWKVSCYFALTQTDFMKISISYPFSNDCFTLTSDLMHMSEDEESYTQFVLTRCGFLWTHQEATTVAAWSAFSFPKITVQERLYYAKIFFMFCESLADLVHNIKFEKD